MLDGIRKLFLKSAAKTGDSKASLHLAAAVLLVEVAKCDRNVDDEEILRLRSVLKNGWQLDEAELDGLVGVARDASDRNVSLDQHIDLINRNFSAARKFDLFRSLWRTACADGVIHHREEALIERLGDLLNVSNDELARSKRWALEPEERE